MQAKLRTGINPLAYLGVDPITPPMLKIEDRDPTNNDFAEYEIGAIWLVGTPTKVWMMVSKDPNPAITKWIQLYPGDGSGTNFFPTDSGTAVQVGGYLNIFGSNDIATMASGNTVTVALENDVTIVNSLTLTPILNKVLTTDGTGLVTGVSGTNKQILMWSVPDGDVPGFHSVVSDDGTVNFEWSALTPGAISITAIGGGGGGFGGLIADDTNTAVPSLNKVNVFGDGINLDTTASGSTLTVALRNILTLPRTNSAASQGVIILGTERFITNLGTDNTFVGEQSGNFTLTTGSATGNTGIGTGVLNDLTSSANNTGVGVGALTAVADGNGTNTAVGALAGGALVNGHNNVFIGGAAGINYTSESHNISISNEGVALDTGVIRIGNTTDHSHCYIGGIYGASGGATNGVVSADNDGKLSASNGTNGQVLIGGGTGSAWATITSSDSSIIFTPGANQLDMVAVGGGGSSGITKLGADTGTPALPLLGEVDIIGGTNINTQTAPNSVVVNLDDWVSLPATNAAGTAGGISINSNKFMHAMGTDNTFLGKNAGNLALTVAYGEGNTGIGSGALAAVSYAAGNVAIGYRAIGTLVGGSSSGLSNVAVGNYSLENLSSAHPSVSVGNTCVGFHSGNAMTEGRYNTTLGYNAGDSITTGDYNICIGYNSDGGTATSNGNISIGPSNISGNIGIGTSVVSDTTTTRIGAAQNKCYISGIYGAGTDNAALQQYFCITDSTKKVYAGLGAAGTANGQLFGTNTDIYGTKQGAWINLTSSNGSITITPNAYSGDIDIKTAGTRYAFHAVQSRSASNVTGDGTIYYLGASAAFSEIYDYNSNFYPGNGSGTKALFTAPVTGLYLFICTVLATGLPSGATTRVDPIYIFTSNRTYQLINPVINYTTTSGTQTITFTAMADMDTSDTAYFGFGLQTSVGTKTVGVGATYTTISGHFIS